MMETLISPAYQAEQIRLHAGPKAYGERGHKWATQVNALLWLHGCASVLDYGCGRGTLRDAVYLTGRCPDIREYDPAITGKDALPTPADLVVCSDVLEHVEPEKIEAVLDHLVGLTIRLLFVVIALTDTAHILSDGRQAHILLRPVSWWHAHFQARQLALVEQVATSKPEKQWATVWAPC